MIRTTIANLIRLMLAMGSSYGGLGGNPPADDLQARIVAQVFGHVKRLSYPRSLSTVGNLFLHFPALPSRKSSMWKRIKSASVDSESILSSCILI